MSADDLFLIRQRIVNIEKAFNTIYACFSRADNMPPRIFVDEPFKSGRQNGERLDESKWNEMLDEFYESDGWAKETVEQTRDSLLRLDLGDVWQTLEEHNGTQSYLVFIRREWRLAKAYGSIRESTC
jgi:aldehyde:ferredoxin oxidoreductase